MNASRILVSLRVPSGWYVEHNVFYDSSEASDLVEDLLLATHRNYGFSLMLGWLPAGDAAGAFRLVLARTTSADPLRVFVTTEAGEVVDCINRWFAEVARRSDFSSS